MCRYEAFRAYDWPVRTASRGSFENARENLGRMRRWSGKDGHEAVVKYALGYSDSSITQQLKLKSYLVSFSTYPDRSTQLTESIRRGKLMQTSMYTTEFQSCLI